jgi:DNA-binding transcriptional LysR family regulator
MLAPPRELELAGFRMSLLWHERTHHDAAHRWLRDLFVSVAGEIG